MKNVFCFPEYEGSDKHDIYLLKTQWSEYKKILSEKLI